MALLTPIAKAFVTEAGYEAANHGVQIYGGHGFIREWGMEQIVRDARIAMLYEGTTGIQALDLLGRKVLGFRRQAADGLYGSLWASTSMPTTTRPTRTSSSPWPSTRTSG
jgi:hypothetical protein